MKVLKSKKEYKIAKILVQTAPNLSQAIAEYESIHHNHERAYITQPIEDDAQFFSACDQLNYLIKSKAKASTVNILRNQIINYSNLKVC